MKPKKIKKITIHKDFSKNKEMLDKIFGGNDNQNTSYMLNVADLEFYRCTPSKMVIYKTE